MAKDATTAKRFGDFHFGELEVDEWVNVEDLIDRDLLFEDFQERKGQLGTFFAIKVRDQENDKSLGFSCGGQVVMRKLAAARDEGFLPLVGRITKPGEYYDIV